MATSKLDILISAKNNASSAINTVKSDLSGLDKAAGSIAGGLGSLAGAAGVAGLVAMGTAAAGAAMEMARASAETERLGTAFDTLAGQAGQSGDAMLAAMDAAAQGTISNADLMLTANKAMLLGVADSAQEMAQLMDVAAARGKAMGMTTADAFSDLVTAVGRLSAPIADNLGITVDAEKAYAAYARQLGVTSESLTEAQKKQAFLNDVIKNSTDIVNANKNAGMDAASNFERMDAAITNAKDAMGELFQPAMVIIAQGIADAAEAATRGMQEMAGGAGTAGLSADELSAQMADLQATITDTAAKMKHMEDTGQSGSDMYAQMSSHVADLRGKIDQLRSAHDTLIPSIELANRDFEQTSMSADDARRALGLLGDEALNTGSKMLAMGADALAAMEQMNMALDVNQQIQSAANQAGVLFGAKQGGDAGLAKQKAVNEELQAQKQTWLDMHYTTKEIDEVLMPAYIQSLNEADRATFKVASGTAKISDEARAAQQAFDDLTNTVAGVLSGALDPGVGVDPSDILPREDAVNEDARRLADIAVNGWASPWAEYFRKEFPDQFQEMAASNDIKQGAAIMLRNFQDGLEPELINKDEAKERVRKMLIGDQNMAALATEIATELAAEMGIPMQQALAAAQGTLGGGTGMGTEAATSFADGASQALDEGNGGGSFVTKFTEQMKASYGLLSQAGKDAGKLWGANFLEVVGENVPPALVKILTDLVTPGVVAALAQKGSLTGATP